MKEAEVGVAAAEDKTAVIGQRDIKSGCDLSRLSAVEDQDTGWRHNNSEKSEENFASSPIQDSFCHYSLDRNQKVSLMYNESIFCGILCKFFKTP